MSTTPQTVTPARAIARHRWWPRIRGCTARLLANPSAAAGVLLLTIFVVLALGHPLLMSTVWADEQMVYRPVAGYDLTIDQHPAPPSVRHLLGTETLGRDVLSMLMVALRPTLVTALTTAVIIGALSIAAASAAAYFRRWVDTSISLLADALVLLPAPVVIILVAIALPPDVFGPPETGVLYGLLAGLSTATIVLRSQALAVMGKPFIDASRIAGGSSWHMIRRHLVPHLLPLAFVQMMVGVVGVIVATAFAQYLTNPNDVLGLGTMLYAGLTFQGFFTTTVAWNLLLSAALSITGLCAGFYLLGRGIRQLTDPRTVARNRTERVREYAHQPTHASSR